MICLGFLTRSTPELKGPDDLVVAVGMGASFLDVSVIAPTRKAAESTVSADAVADAGAGGSGGKKKKKGKGKSAQSENGDVDFGWWEFCVILLASLLSLSLLLQQQLSGVSGCRPPLLHGCSSSCQASLIVGCRCYMVFSRR